MLKNADDLNPEQKTNFGLQPSFDKNDSAISLFVGNIPNNTNITASIVQILGPFVFRFHRMVYHNSHAFLDCTLRRGCSLEQMMNTTNGVQLRHADGSVSIAKISTANSQTRPISTYIEDRNRVFLYPVEAETPLEEVRKFIEAKCELNLLEINRVDDCRSVRIILSSYDDAYRLIGGLNGRTFANHRIVATHMEPLWTPRGAKMAAYELQNKRDRPRDGVRDIYPAKKLKDSEALNCKNITSFYLAGFRSINYPYTAELVILFKPFVKSFLKIRHRDHGYAFFDVDLKEGMSPSDVIQQLNNKQMGPDKSEVLKVNIASKPSGTLLQEITQTSDTLYAYPVPRIASIEKFLSMHGYTGCPPKENVISELNALALVFQSCKDAEYAHSILNDGQCETNFTITRMGPGGFAHLLQTSSKLPSPKMNEKKRHFDELHDDARGISQKLRTSTLAIYFEDLYEKNYNFTSDIVRLLQPYVHKFLKVRKYERSTVVEVVPKSGITEESIHAALRSMPLNEFQGKVRIAFGKGRASPGHQDNPTVLYIYPFYKGLKASELSDFLDENECFPQHAVIDHHNSCIVLVMHSCEEASDAIRSLNGKFWGAMRCPIVCTHMHP